MTVLNIAIIGTRGIPNHYGGFEQAAEFLSKGLVKKGHRVTVYNSHSHAFKGSTFHGVQIVHCYDPENILGTAGQFLYDFNCIRNASKKKFDILLFLGYTSSSIWWRLFPKNTVIVSNMDGVEWKRSKYSRMTRSFLRYAEKLAVDHSQFLIADSIGIQKHLFESYDRHAAFIPYGGDEIRNEDNSILTTYDLKPGQYYLVIARIEPENNIDMVLQGFLLSASKGKFIVVGNNKNSYGRVLTKKYAADKRIFFTGAIYDQDQVHTLRKNCSIYFHGHSVGGTNPSLLEAMASGSLIAAHDNVFNRSVLEGDAYYFSNYEDITRLIDENYPGRVCEDRRENNYRKIREIYNWQKIVDQYEELLVSCFQKYRNEENFHNT